MDKSKIKSEISRLEEIEDGLLLKFVYEAKYCSEKQLRFVSKKIFEISDLILRLKTALAEIENEG